MKAAIAALGGLTAGLFAFDLMWAFIRQEFAWTTVRDLVKGMGYAHNMPQFVEPLISMPAMALFLVPAILFYLLVLWLDFS